MVSDSELSQDDAITGLEESVALVRDGGRPELRDYRDLVALVEFAIGRAISSIAGPSSVVTRPESMVAERLRFTNGIELALTHDGRVAEVWIEPEAVAKTLKLFAMAGIAPDLASDVARNHDDYLVDAYLNAASGESVN